MFGIFDTYKSLYKQVEKLEGRFRKVAERERGFVGVYERMRNEAVQRANGFVASKKKAEAAAARADRSADRLRDFFS